MKKEKSDNNTYYVVKKKALPEVLLKVVEVKRMLESDPGKTVQKATEAVDLSRSSFYKYKDDIFVFHENVRGKTITFLLVMDDIPGILAELLKIVAQYRANILTIHQTIPINGVATLTMSVDILADSADVSNMLDAIEEVEGIHELKILGRE